MKTEEKDPGSKSDVESVALAFVQHPTLENFTALKARVIGCHKSILEAK